MATNLDTIFKKIRKNSTQMAVQAMRDVANQAYQLSINKAKECLKRYYSNYQPKRYKRTRNLQKAIKPIKPVEKSKNGNYIIGFAIKYDSRHLNGLYKSNSWYHQTGSEWVSRDSTNFNFQSQDNGGVDSDFILGNYLKGIHPWAQTDAVSTEKIMTHWMQSDLPSRAGDMIYKEMQGAILKFISSSGGGK